MPLPETALARFFISDSSQTEGLNSGLCGFQLILQPRGFFILLRSYTVDIIYSREYKTKKGKLKHFKMLFMDFSQKRTEKKKRHQSYLLDLYQPGRQEKCWHCSLLQTKVNSVRAIDVVHKQLLGVILVLILIKISPFLMLNDIFPRTL